MVYNLDFSIPQPFLLPRGLGNLEIHFFLPWAFEEQVPFFGVSEGDIFKIAYVQGKKGQGQVKDKSINALIDGRVLGVFFFKF